MFVSQNPSTSGTKLLQRTASIYFRGSPGADRIEVPVQSVSPKVQIGTLLDVPLAAFEESPTPIKIVRQDGTVVYRNQAMVRLSQSLPEGVPVEAGMNLHDWHSPEVATERIALMTRLAVQEHDAVVRNIVMGEQMLIHLRLLPRRAGESQRSFLYMYERAAGPAHAKDFADVEFYDAKHQYLGPLETLSQREIEVLALIGEGLTAAQIAMRIHRAEETVNSHKSSLMRKLACHNATQLAIIAYRAGLKYTDGERLGS